jgi:plasmid stabilization system protein ParE
MMYKVIWSEPAKDDYWQNIDYLLENWTEIVAIKFIEAVERNLRIIAKDPRSFAST